MKQKSTKVMSVEFEINGKILKMSLEQARELRDMLNNAFPKETSQFYPYNPVIYYKYWNEPVYTPSSTLTVSSSNGYIATTDLSTEN
jgi:hypothetical protein